MALVNIGEAGGEIFTMMVMIFVILLTPAPFPADTKNTLIPDLLTPKHKILDFHTKTHEFTFFLTQCWKFWHPHCRWAIIDTKMMARLIGRWKCRRIWQLKARDLRDSSEQPTYHCLTSLSIWTYPPLSVIIVCGGTTNHHCTSEFVPSFLATLVALHFTPASQWVGGQSFGLA